MTEKYCAECSARLVGLAGVHAGLHAGLSAENELERKARNRWQH